MGKGQAQACLANAGCCGCLLLAAAAAAAVSFFFEAAVDSDGQ